MDFQLDSQPADAPTPPKLHTDEQKQQQSNLTGSVNPYDPTSSVDQKGNQTREKQQTFQTTQAPTGLTRFLSLAFYEQFFQVNQTQVLQRLKLSLIPIKRQFIDKIRPNPDFYGPFWLLTTIIFLLGSTGNLSRYFANWDKPEFVFRLELVRIGVLVVYSFGFGVPLLLYGVMKFMEMRMFSLPELICLYGYSYGCFILIFILCIIPFSWFQWILMVYGMLNSIAFIILNMWPHLEDPTGKSAYVVYGIIGAAQIVLFLTFKLVFFNLIYEN